ncbi:MAG: pyridoxal-phosphate dependent enzyme [Anaerolineae bacterium]
MRIPRLIGVQASGSSPLVSAWEKNLSALEMQPVEATTIADSISAGVPRDRAKALRAVRDTNGAFVAIPDDEIIASIPKMARLTGVFCEPSCAITYAGARRALELGYLKPHERVVFLLTGNGLKDVRRAQASVAGGIRVAPQLEAIRRALKLD